QRRRLRHRTSHLGRHRDGALGVLPSRGLAPAGVASVASGRAYEVGKSRTMSVGFPGPVVVLGHSRFIGRPLAAGLKDRGADVHGFSSRELDLRDLTSFGRLDPLMSAETTIFVCAALTPDRGATLDACLDHIKLTGNIARYLARHTARRTV